MHKALLIQDIFHCILDFAISRDTEVISYYPDGNPFDSALEDLEIDKRTALNIALTCKAFHPLAIGLLWRTLWSLDPLLQTLPEDIWKVRTTVYSRDQCKHDFVG